MSATETYYSVDEYWRLIVLQQFSCEVKLEAKPHKPKFVNLTGQHLEIDLILHVPGEHQLSDKINVNTSLEHKLPKAVFLSVRGN